MKKNFKYKPNKELNSSLFFTLIFLELILGCTPKVYVIDRQNILEEEAAGGWPDLSAELISKRHVLQPTLLPQNKVGIHQVRPLTLLNGNIVTDMPLKGESIQK